MENTFGIVRCFIVGKDYKEQINEIWRRQFTRNSQATQMAAVEAPNHDGLTSVNFPWWDYREYAPMLFHWSSSLCHATWKMRETKPPFTAFKTNLNGEGLDNLLIDVRRYGIYSFHSLRIIFDSFGRDNIPQQLPLYPPK